MTPQELKNSILQLAIQGKLVEQRTEEGTAEELYQQIQQEKQRLGKEGKIKKERPILEIIEEEKTFDIPDSWKWVRLLDICSSITDIDHNMPKSVSQGYPLLSAKDINDDLTLNFQKDIKRISYEDFCRMSLKSKPEFGDIIFSRIGTLGRVGIVNVSCDFLVSYSCCTIKQIIINNRYLAYCLQGPEMQIRIIKAKTGIGVPDLGIKMIKEFLIPLPPLAEQKRIVAKIEELLPLIDRYEKAWSRLEEFNKRFPDDMQKSILQMAIQGKLVEQRPEEGTGEELYQQIQAEKQKLIKDGKIKKEKPLSEIAEEEKPFDIPESWKWVHWGDLVNVVSARRVHQADWRDAGIPFYRAREIARLAEDGQVDNELFISEQLYNEFSQSGVPHVGDLMVTAVGTLGKTYIVQEKDCFYYKDASVICLENYGHMIPEYLKYVMQSEMMMNQVRSNSGGTTVATLTIVRMNEYLVPLPPLEEQKRIVAKIEELLPLCESLKQN